MDRFRRSRSAYEADNVMQGHGLQRVRYSFSFVAISLVMMFIAFLLGAFDPATLTQSDGLRMRNGAIALPLMSGFMLFSHYHLNQRWRACLQLFLKRNKVSMSPAEMESHLDRGVRNGKRAAVIFSLVMTSVYLLSENLLRADSGALELYLCFIAFFFWGLIFLVIYELIFITQFVLKHFLNTRLIDLFGIEKLSHLSDLVITNAIISAIGLCLVPLFWLGRDVPWVDRIIVATVFIVLVCFLFWPVTRIQSVISNKKDMAVSRINDAIKTLFNDNSQRQRRLTDDPERLRRLSALINAKQEITAVSEWPVDIPQGIKSSLILLSIPASWAIGAVVENIIEAMKLI
ncbi:hypothetical protein [Alteromonas sp. H39]|uniref:hypothetical protein n=1 Tax=Alteromonas sp. H39 TaxID=3389876 RepID=UPI0039E0F543